MLHVSIETNHRQEFSTKFQKQGKMLCMRSPKYYKICGSVEKKVIHCVRRNSVYLYDRADATNWITLN